MNSGALAARPGAVPPTVLAAPVSNRLVRAAYAALAWVVVFFALHVYWYAGGFVGRAGPLPDAPHSVRGWIYEVLVVSAFPRDRVAALSLNANGARP
ncbi:MAG: hypothetical protein WBP81_29460 [Solirubrobacteraceae bacterium]